MLQAANNIDYRGNSDSSSQDSSSGKDSSDTSNKSSKATTTTTTTTSTPATSAANSDSSTSSRIVTSKVAGTYKITCPGTGFYRESTKCSVFYQCAQAGVEVYGTSCVTGLSFDFASNNCNWANQVTDC